MNKYCICIFKNQNQVYLFFWAGLFKARLSSEKPFFLQEKSMLRLTFNPGLAFLYFTCFYFTTEDAFTGLMSRVKQEILTEVISKLNELTSISLFDFL